MSTQNMKQTLFTLLLISILNSNFCLPISTLGNRLLSKRMILSAITGSGGGSSGILGIGTGSDDTSTSDTTAAANEDDFALINVADLARNSARLHRTLFLLDTSDLLKKARLFASLASKSISTTNSLDRSNLDLDLKNENFKQDLMKRRKRNSMNFDSNLNLNQNQIKLSTISRTKMSQRLRREAKATKTGGPTRYINIIKVRKPFLSINEDEIRNGLSEKL